MAGVVEMLLQSHEGYIRILPALPAPTGFVPGSTEAWLRRYGGERDITTSRAHPKAASARWRNRYRLAPANR